MDKPEVETGQNRCRNCGATLRGEYCHHCGQREGRGDLHFADAAGEVLGDLFTWDSRFWRTLFPLVFRPGFLTAEFIAGRRARYVPPFRLYIIISFVLFLVLSLLARDFVDVDVGSEDTPLVTSSGEPLDPNQRAEAEAAIAEAQQQLDELGIPVTIRQQPPWGGSDQVSGDLDPAPAGDDSADRMAMEADDVDIGLADADSPVWLQELDRRIENNARRLRDDPGQFVELMLDYLPQMMFLMLPVFALLLQFCYLLSSFHYLQHLVFGLHYHSFVYLLYLMGEAAERLGNAIGGWLLLALVIYLPLGLRRAYGSGFPGALAKSLFLYFGYGIVLLVGFALVVLVALALM